MKMLADFLFISHNFPAPYGTLKNTKKLVKNMQHIRLLLGKIPQKSASQTAK